MGGETRLDVLEDSYHLVHLDREMEDVAAATAAFFDLPHAARSDRAGMLYPAMNQSRA